MTEEQAKARFLIVQMVRLTGIALAVFGLAVIAGKTSLPVAAGYVLFVIGLFESMFVPILLTKRWKSGGQ
jgi:type IV secretory pathway VirB2 component (pilin)